MKKVLVLVASLLLPCLSQGNDIASYAAKAKSSETAAMIRNGEASVLRYRAGLERTVAYMRAHPELFPADKQAKPRMLNSAEKQQVLSVWRSFLDHCLALDSLLKYYKACDTIGDKKLKVEAYRVFYGAFLCEYRYAMDFIALAENDPGLDVLLNDPVPELGLQKDAYAQVKYRFLHLGRATEFACGNAFYMLLANGTDKLDAAIKADAAVVWGMGLGKGEAMTLTNAVSVVKNAGFTLYFPVQAGISEWMGDTKVAHAGEILITQKQVAEFLPRLQPGDVLVERHEWYLSNIGLPGFWTHAALYVGTPEERRAFLAKDEEVGRWLAKQGRTDGNYEKFLAAKFPRAYATSLVRHENGHPSRILEAISEGVSFTSIEFSGASDSLAVLRPRLSKKDKAAAIARAFGYSGRPYDFNFDFLTDSSLVCTELVYKSYEPGQDVTGLHFTLQDLMGHTLMSANDLVQQFDEQQGTPRQQFDLVLFLDGSEKANRAFESDLAAFRQSWKRPKWHVLTAEPPQK